jgi:DNA-binding SARP family transcriptional activator
MVADGTSNVEFRLLGPVEVWIGGRSVDAGQPRQRAVLAALLVDAGRVVSVDTLIERVWGPAVPEKARPTLRTHLSRIRRLLEQAGAALSRVPGGYLLRVDPDHIDLHLFRRLAAAENPVGSLRSALGLWRGQPLAGVEGEWAGRMREIWSQERVDTAVALARAELAQSNPGPALTCLAELACDNPLAEPLTEVMMRALHAADRTSEALELYDRTRRHLAEALGADPGPELQALHRSLLRGEVETAAGPRPQVPRQLPVAPPLFTGRTVELAELGKIHDASTVVITAIDGMAGIGKTALAVQAAHQMADRYPDGQLFIDLHGYTEGVAPVEPGEALDWLLRSLGLAGNAVPAALDQRAGLYRNRLRERRMVIVLDNAATEAQVRPLLPGAPGCVVLVTSRRRLGGLEHTHSLSLGTLPLTDAAALVRHTAGLDRLAGQPPQLVDELVELCGRLPLALRIAAARLRSHPAWNLAHLVTRLRDEQNRLAELAAGQRSVTAALDLSYMDLSSGQQRAYRRLGLFFGSDIDVYAAAAVLDATLSDAGRRLDQLLEAHLLQESSPGHFRSHDLTRAHAAHTATRDEPERDRQIALDRLLDYYRHAAVVAMDVVYPYEREYRPPVPPAAAAVPSLPDRAAALDWLNRELSNLLAAARCAADHDRPDHVLHLSSILHGHLRIRGLYDEAEILHQQALTITGDQAAGLGPLTGLGDIYVRQGKYERAADYYQQALRLARAAGNPAAELRALTGLGNVHRMQSRYEQAADHYEQALLIARATGHRTGELEAVDGLGHMHRVQGRYEQAADHYQQALELARATGHLNAEQNIQTGLGLINRIFGRYDEATHHYEQALRLARVTGDREVQRTDGIGQGRVVVGLEGAARRARDSGRIGVDTRVRLSSRGDEPRLQLSRDQRTGVGRRCLCRRRRWGTEVERGDEVGYHGGEESHDKQRDAEDGPGPGDRGPLALRHCASYLVAGQTVWS